MKHDADKRMKAVQQRYKSHHDEQMLTAPKKIEIWQYLYLEGPPMTTSAAGGLASQSNSKVLSAKTGPFFVVEVKPSTVMMDGDSIGNTISVNRATVAQTAKETRTRDNRTQNNKSDAELKET